MTTLVRARVLAGAVSLSVLASAGAANAAGPSVAAVAAPGEAILTGRLLAPCCWTQTLDAHESELATSLRGEIRTRLSAGEAAGAIEDDLAARYTDRIRAVPKGDDVRLAIPIVSGVVALGGALGLALLLFRWTRRSRGEPRPGGRPAEARDGYDDRIDAALRELD